MRWKTVKYRENSADRSTSALTHLLIPIRSATNRFTENRGFERMRGYSAAAPCVQTTAEILYIRSSGERDESVRCHNTAALQRLLLSSCETHVFHNPTLKINPFNARIFATAKSFGNNVVTRSVCSDTRECVTTRRTCARTHKRERFNTTTCV